MDQSSSPQNPRAQRSNVLLAASIECRGSRFAVKLCNLSPQGALVVGDGLPPEGTTVMFCRNDLRVRSHVAWVDGSNAGIAFQKPLEPQVVLRNISKARARASLAAPRPGLASRPLTADEEKLNGCWISSAPTGALGD
jgi:hypothetical protein